MQIKSVFPLGLNMYINPDRLQVGACHDPCTNPEVREFPNTRPLSLHYHFYFLNCFEREGSGW